MSCCYDGIQRPSFLQVSVEEPVQADGGGAVGVV